MLALALAFLFFLFCLILLIKVHHPKSSSLRPDRVIIKEGSAGRVEVEVGVRGEGDGGRGCVVLLVEVAVCI